jgi:hypothetical protein
MIEEEANDSKVKSKIDDVQSNTLADTRHHGISSSEAYAIGDLTTKSSVFIFCSYTTVSFVM